MGNSAEKHSYKDGGGVHNTHSISILYALFFLSQCIFQMYNVLGTYLRLDPYLTKYILDIRHPCH